MQGVDQELSVAQEGISIELWLMCTKFLFEMIKIF